MNEVSSRSHAVFSIVVSQRHHDTRTSLVGEKVYMQTYAYQVINHTIDTL